MGGGAVQMSHAQSHVITCDASYSLIVLRTCFIWTVLIDEEPDIHKCETKQIHEEQEKQKLEDEYAT
jgi:hypothetical protein